MQISTYKTDLITTGSHNLLDLLDTVLSDIPEESIVTIAAKIVSLCEGRVVARGDANLSELVHQESQWYLPPEGQYNLSFTIAHNLLVPMAGVDESNAGEQYVLWPEDPQASANTIRDHLVQKHGRRSIGVIITDSGHRPLQWGTTGIAIAYSGFRPLKSYIGQKDLFGRTFQFHTANIANGLAAAAVTMMGEGAEQTPLALLTDVPFVEFQDRNPSDQELEDLRISYTDDLYGPLLRAVTWHKGAKKP